MLEHIAQAQNRTLQDDAVPYNRRDASHSVLGQGVDSVVE